ncbi:SGNH/GDSL hydrolase family protein [Neobacillus sp. LXY-1]|uniref:SGNH/GDSL hydrolase family protein n=1 Tax=Neobacillus sp. LXY-1 TaxID=3379133 RepID=UPI003EDE8401
MKTFFTYILGLITIGVLIYGHSYWNQKIEAAPKRDSSAVTKQDIQESEANSSNLLAFAKNWPADSIEEFKQAMTEKRPFKILFVGSPAIGSETDGAYPIIKNKLLETYGEKNIQVGIKTFNSTSTQLLHSPGMEEVIGEKADLVVLEPFILLNNGKIKIGDTLKNVTQMMNDIKAGNPKMTFILQPSYPLYNAKNYPTQVGELKKFAESNQISYLDHWAAWPDSNTSEFKNYLLPDQSAPSEKGNRMWSEYLIKYFISQD